MSHEATRPAATPEQSAALAVRGASVALRSGAGCGKTTVLTQRYLAEIEGSRLDALVAVTFTDKAAAELRERIRKRCRERALSEPRSGRWRTILRELEASRVSTFHRFCREIIDRFPIEAGVPPGSEVLLEQLAPTLRDEALAAAIRGWLADPDDDFESLAVEFGIDDVREAIRALLSSRSSARLAHWAATSADDLLAHWQALWESKGRGAILDELRPIVERTLGLLRRPDFTDPKARGVVGPLLDDLPRVLEPVGDDPTVLLARIREVARVQGTTVKHWPSPECYAEVKAAFERLRKEAERVGALLDVDPTLSRRAAAQGAQFARLTHRALEEFARRKKQSEWLDFDDLISRARDLLIERDPDLAATLVDEVGLLLVDEFQDTDEIQVEILRAMGGPSATTGRLFLVGDSKQAIYGFRGARPRIFDDVRATFPPQGHLDLSTNFRSVPAVLDFVNALFAGSELDPDSSSPLLAGVAVEPRARPLPPDHPPAVEFFWDAADDAESGEGQPRPRAEDRRREEARRLARLLAERLTRGWPIWDVPERRWRDAARGDVAFLFRTLGDVSPYEQALAEAGLDFHTTGGSAFFAQQEVLDVVNLLATIEDPLDPLALAAVLRSPFFRLSDDALYWLATWRPDDRPTTLDRNLDRVDQVAPLTRAERRRAQLAREQLGRWRGLKDTVPIPTLLDRALDESGYEAALLAQPRGARRRANLRKLVRLARDYDRAGFAMADFAARLRRDFRRLTREDEAATTTEGVDAIRLLTIHSAKGLEFPIVVLPDLDRKPPPSRERFQIDPELGPLVRPSVDPEDESPSGGEDGQDLGSVLHKVLGGRAERAEAVRLFYVATTRARNHLILSSAGTPASLATSANPAAKLLAERFDLAEATLQVPLPAEWPRPVVRCVEQGAFRRSPVGAVAIPQAPIIDSRGLLAILRTRPSSESIVEARRPIGAPLLIDLDAPPGRAAASRRVDQLVTAVLARPGGLQPRLAGRLAATIGRAAVPAASARLIDEAIRRLAVARECPDLIKAARDGAERATVFTSIAEDSDGRRIALRGTLDLFRRRSEDCCEAFCLARPEVAEDWELLRLASGARALAPDATVDLCLIRPNRTIRRSMVSPKDTALTALIDAALLTS